MKGKILICEDDESVSKVTERLLVYAGYTVFVANSGSTALEMLYRPQRIDLLLTDIVLPLPVSGLHLATRARALLPELPIIFMTGYLEIDFREQSGHLRKLAVLGKPVPRHELLEVVALHLCGTMLGTLMAKRPSPEMNLAGR